MRIIFKAYREESIVTVPDQPLLSVVVPAYNEERRLPETLAQIMAYLERQTYPFELIVADDGSEIGRAHV